MYKVKIDNKTIDIDGSITVEQLINDNFEKPLYVAAKLNDKLVDLSCPITEDAKIDLIKPNDPDGLEIIRHTCAHLFGHALKQIYPDAKMVIGPTIENGFYYDIYSSDPISEKELKSIETVMKKLSKKNYKIIREVVSKEKALDVFNIRNEDYKIKLIEEIPDDEIIALYYHEEYTDMCRGPHLVSTKHLNYFKLMKVSGSYW